MSEEADNRVQRLLGAHPFGLWVANLSRLAPGTELDDIKPGCVIFSHEPHAVEFVPAGDAPQLGCIAGWISDEEAA